MSAPSEKDAILVLSVAKLLSVELDEWQERVLLAMFSAHRELAAERGPYGRCDSWWLPGPDLPAVRCSLPRRHAGDHRDTDLALRWPNLG